MKKSMKSNLRNNGKNIKWEYDVIYIPFHEHIEGLEDVISNLRKEVNMKCNEGWIPEGPMSVLNKEICGSKYFCQTMIRQVLVSDAREDKVVRTEYYNLELSDEVPMYDGDDGEL